MANTEGAEKKGKYTPKYLLEEIEAKDNVTNTLFKSLAQVAVTGVAGSFLGAVLGNYSFPIGAALIGAGNYKDVAWMAPLGTGMISAAIARPKDPPPPADEKGMSGFDLKTEMDNAGKRAQDWKETFMSRTYLNKIFKTQAAEKQKNESAQRTFEAEEQAEVMYGLDEAPENAPSVEEVEKQLIASAMKFQREQQGKQAGFDADLTGLEEEVDFSSM